MGYIRSIGVNEFDGAFVQTVPFTEGLNIISGVNGTGKTTVLKNIKAGKDTQAEGSVSAILAFSPKRNSEKKRTEEIIQFVRQQGRRSTTVLAEALNKAMHDHVFERYESLGDIFVYDFEERCRSGQVPQVQVMQALTNEYNSVIKGVFTDYQIQSGWNEKIGSSGGPEVKLITPYGVPIDLNFMSCGESEVLALIFNIYFNRNSADVYLIDEPEVHLNWSLEKGLFTFLDTFAQENRKQIIVTTHSRIIFDARFSQKTQFFVFKNRKVLVQTTSPPEYLEEIAGETAAMIGVAAPTRKTFFVEDEVHRLMISELLKLHGSDAEVVIVKDASGMIQNLYKLIRSNSEFNERWVNAYLVVDGDGKEPMYQEDSRFIHLQRFSAESYFFNIETMAKVFGISENDLREQILSLIKENPEGFRGQHFVLIERFLDRLIPGDVTIELMSSFDSSSLLRKLLRARRSSSEAFISAYIRQLHHDALLDKIFERKLLEGVKQNKQESVGVKEQVQKIAESVRA